MKKLLCTLLVAMTALAASAQGKVMFVNDSLHSYYMNQAMLPADAAYAGQPIPLGGTLPSGITLVADLYAGTSSGSLFLYSTTTFSSLMPGQQNLLGVTLNDPDGAGPAVALPGGTMAYFQVQVRDSAYATAHLALMAWSYGGYSQTFTAVPSSTIAFNSIVNHGGTALSTWTDAPPGYAALYVPLIPEPSILSMAGLGLAACLAAQRRKRLV